MEPVVLVHGGAAVIADERICGKTCGIQQAAKTGHQTLKNGGSAVDAVEAAIVSMENNEYFNAGFGSVLNLDGEVEMDASIMDGRDLSAGAVAMVKDIANPINLARLVRERTPHVLIAGTGVSEFAKAQGIPTVPPSSLVSEYAQTVLEQFKQQGGRDEDRELGGTVGAIAIDKNGNVAAGTSTGGTNGKMLGRIGDTPQIGSGTYADNRYGAVSCTGCGEAILKLCLAHSIVKEMELGQNANDATKKWIDEEKQQLNMDVGAISLSKNGDIGFAFNTRAMPWAYIKNEELHYGVKPDEHFVRPIE